MDWVTQLLMNPNEEKSITVKTKPQKASAPEAPLDMGSANLPQGVMDAFGAQQPQLPPNFMDLIAASIGGGGPSPAPMVDPMANQIPMDVPMNPYAMG